MQRCRACLRGRLEQDARNKADVVLVRDGEWSAPPQVIANVEAAKKTGSRLHGVQVGNVGRTGLHAICEPVHEFRDWAALGHCKIS